MYRDHPLGFQTLKSDFAGGVFVRTCVGESTFSKEVVGNISKNKTNKNTIINLLSILKYVIQGKILSNSHS